MPVAVASALFEGSSDDPMSGQSQVDRLTTVPGGMVPYVRSGLVAEFGSALDMLDCQTALRRIDRRAWELAWARLVDAHALLEELGVDDEPGGVAVKLNVGPGSARVLLDALRAIYEVEAGRLREAQAQRVHLASREVPVLRKFIIEAEQELAAVAAAPSSVGSWEKRTPQTVKGPHADEADE